MVGQQRGGNRLHVGHDQYFILSATWPTRSAGACQFGRVAIEVRTEKKTVSMYGADTRPLLTAPLVPLSATSLPFSGYPRRQVWEGHSSIIALQSMDNCGGTARPAMQGPFQLNSHRSTHYQHSRLWVCIQGEGLLVLYSVNSFKMH